jgi:hypothetical protein
MALMLNEISAGQITRLNSKDNRQGYENMNFVDHAVMHGLSFLATLFVFATGLVALLVAILFIIDASQTTMQSAVTTPYLADFDIFLRGLGNSFGNISLRSTVKSFPSTGQNVIGFIARRPARTIQSRLARHVTCSRQAR